MWLSGFFFSYFVSHSWGIPMMKITGLSHLFKWENLHNWWLTKYLILFCPTVYIYIYIYIYIYTVHITKTFSFQMQCFTIRPPWCNIIQPLHHTNVSQSITSLIITCSNYNINITSNYTVSNYMLYFWIIKLTTLQQSTASLVSVCACLAICCDKQETVWRCAEMAFGLVLYRVSCQCLRLLGHLLW